MKIAIDQSKLAGLEYAKGSVTAHEGVYLQELIKLLNPEVVVEIGSWIGVSTIYLAQAMKEQGKGKVFAIDPHQNYALHRRRHLPDTEPILRENLKRFEVEEFVQVIRKTSLEALSSWVERIDLLFVDGNHLFNSVRADFFGFSPWIPSGGVLVFHDYLKLAGPRRVVDEIVKPSNLWEELGCVQRLIAFRRKR